MILDLLGPLSDAMNSLTQEDKATAYKDPEDLVSYAMTSWKTELELAWDESSKPSLRKEGVAHKCVTGKKIGC